jgi:DNA-binding SARP family transcriptional activator/ATP/maltotriose-dependent transcriptional regulator MalT
MAPAMRHNRKTSGARLWHASWGVEREGEVSVRRSRRAAGIIERPRVARLLGTSPLVVLEAPSGYGKTTIALRWAATLDFPVVQVVLRDTTDRLAMLTAVRTAFRRAGLLVLADAVDPDDAEGTLTAIHQLVRLGGSIAVIVDEFQRATDDAAEWVAELGASLADGSHLIVAGRRLPAAINRRPEDAWTTIDADDLAFDAEEVAALLHSGSELAPDDADVAAVLDASGGWPAAVALAATTRESNAGRPDPATAPQGNTRERVLRQLLARLLARVDERTRLLAHLAAQVPLLSDEVAAVLGGEGALGRLADAGLPIRFRGDGWAELPDAVRDQLADEPLPEAMSRAVASIYARGGELAEAVTLLARTGDHPALLSLVADEHPERLARVGLAFFEVVIDQMSDEQLAERPQAIVQLIRAAERSVRLRDVWLNRAKGVVREDSEASRAVEAERAFAEARGGELDSGLARAERVIAAADTSEVTTLGRAHLVRAYCQLLSDTASTSSAAAVDLERAVACFNIAGERAWEAEAHQAIGYGCLYTSGALEASIDRLERSLALRSAPDANRSQGLTYYAEVLGEAGRYADAEVALREARAIAQRLGDERSIAYAAWSIARLAGLRRDAATVTAALDEAEAHPGEWLGGLAGIDFLLDAALARMRVGDAQGALVDLERAEAQAGGTPREDVPLSARARYEVTYGDAVAAVAVLDRLDASAFAYPSDRWQRFLLRALALTRAGRAAEATTVLAQAERLVGDSGDADRIARQEPELLAMIRPSAAAVLTASGGATVTLLGRFSVARAGADVSPPPGRPATLVKLLALRGTMTSDEAIDALWPDADLDVGRARLRNVLNRIRASSGNIISRRGSALVLEGDVTVDAVRFEREAAAAIAAPPGERAALGRRALAWSTGELLPEERYAEWADLPRERLARRRLDLLDLVASDALERGDLADASQLLDAAIADDPLDESRYVRLARALLAQGRSQSAADVVRRAVAVAEELGVSPSDDVSAVLAAVESMGHAS